MYSIRDIAQKTGFSPDTLRYYEKIGLLKPQRTERGVRTYDDADIQYLKSIGCLKTTGLSLDEVKEFIGDGLRPSPSVLTPDAERVIRRRKSILSAHLESLQEQRRHLDLLIQQMREKLEKYNDLLEQKKEVHSK